MFRGREDIIECIHDYITTECPRVPMVLHGMSGSGKTSIIAKAASLVHQWLPDSKPVRVLRFLGEFLIKCLWFLSQDGKKFGI